MSWVLEGASDDLWYALRGVGLVGRGRAKGRARGSVLEVLLLTDVAREFGVPDPVKAALAWAWEREDGQELSESAAQALSQVSLRSRVLGARVPLVEVGRMMGIAVTRDGLAARGLLID
jgi:hypothetical protein